MIIVYLVMCLSDFNFTEQEAASTVEAMEIVIENEGKGFQCHIEAYLQKCEQSPVEATDM